MTTFDSILLGILQGITEFLPVSSSGHLTLVEHLLGATETSLFYDIMLHVASLLAVVIYFRKRIVTLFTSLFNRDMRAERKTVFMIALSTVATAVLIPITKPLVYRLKADPAFLLPAFLATAILLFTAQKRVAGRPGKGELGFLDALIVGLFQGFAVIPGISRSGSTIAAGLLRGAAPAVAFEYAFLLSIPAIGGAMVLEIAGGGVTSVELVPVLSGMTASFISSIMSLKILDVLVKKLVLIPFAVYLLIPSSIVLYLFWL